MEIRSDEEAHSKGAGSWHHDLEIHLNRTIWPSGKLESLSGLQWYPSHSHDLAMQVAAMPLSLGVSKTRKRRQQ